MRITGGQFRSRKLESPKSDAVRPTSDKVRAALFNMLNSRGLVQASIVFDAFCGTGALGLEALSHGAQYSIFIDKAKSSLVVCKKNITTLSVEDQTKVIRQDATKLKEKPDNLPLVDLVFLDPPYRKGLCEQALNALKEGGWLRQNAYIVIEVASDESLDFPEFKVDQQKTYGDTQIIIGTL